MHVSEFLLDIAKKNIDGEITIDEAIVLIYDHYKQKNKDFQISGCLVIGSTLCIKSPKLRHKKNDTFNYAFWLTQ